MAMFPAVIETEPDLRDTEDNTPKADKKIVPQQKPRQIVTRTNRPVDNGGSDNAGGKE